MELKSKPICGDHLTDDCVCFDYMRGDNKVSRTAD
jgi:hypothetical protein